MNPFDCLSKTTGQPPTVNMSKYVLIRYPFRDSNLFRQYLFYNTVGTTHAHTLVTASYLTLTQFVEGYIYIYSQCSITLPHHTMLEPQD